MPTITLVTIGGLNENGRVAQALGKHFAADVVEPDSFADVTSRLFDDGIAVDIRQQTEAKALRVARICEAVNGDG